MSLQPFCKRRMVAAQKRPLLVDGFVNSVKKLLPCKISSNCDRTFSMTVAQERIIQGLHQGQNIAHQESSHLPYHCQTTLLIRILFQVLGLLDRLKGITTNYVASPCVLKLYEGGQIEMFNNSDYQKLAEFSSFFPSDTNQQPACNFGTFPIYMEDTPLQNGSNSWERLQMLKLEPIQSIMHTGCCI